MSDGVGTVTSVRLPQALLRRAGQLAKRLRGLPDYMPFRMSRSALIRMALARGLDDIEADHDPRPDATSGDKPRKRQLSFKVGAKGGVSVYGLGGKWPTTLYREQWEALLDASDELRAFMRQHRSELK